MQSKLLFVILSTFTTLNLVASAPTSESAPTPLLMSRQTSRCAICTTMGDANQGTAKAIAQSSWSQYPGANQQIMAGTLDNWCQDEKNLKSAADRQVCRDIVAQDKVGDKYPICNSLLAGSNGRTACQKGRVC